MIAPTLSDFPPELIRAVERLASENADLVAQFLDLWIPKFFPPEFVQAPCYPKSFLLAMGCTVRLAIWEAQGISTHLERGLPTRNVAMAVSLSYLVHPEQDTTHYAQAAGLSNKVTQFFLEHFAWTGPEELGGDVALGALDDDSLLDEIAHFSYRHRHDLDNFN